jgi:hypothetical protein
MFARVIAIAVLLLFPTASLFAEDKHPTARVGEPVVVDMTGDLAREYATRTGMPKQENLDLGRVSISLMATIAQYRPDGKYRVEYSLPVAKDKKPARMLTLTSIVDPKQFKTDIAPKNTPVYSSPADIKNGKQPYLTETEEKLLRVELSDLRNTKLQTWALVDEVGN